MTSEQLQSPQAEQLVAETSEQVLYVHECSILQKQLALLIGLRGQRNTG
jgi:hypothetical protein